MQKSPIKDKTLCDRAWDYIEPHTAEALEECDAAQKAVQRARAHVVKVEDIVDELPAQIATAEGELNDRIGKGQELKHVQKRILLLRNKLTDQENWLNNQADKFRAKVAQDYKLAQGRLAQSTQAAVAYCLPELQETLTDRFTEVWDVFRQLANLKNLLAANRRPPLLGKWLIDISSFISTLTNRDELLMFRSEFCDAIDAAFHRSRYAINDANLAKTKAPPAKPKRKTKPVSVVAIEFSEVDAVKIVEEMTGVTLPPRRLVDVKITESNYEKITRELTQEALLLKTEQDTVKQPDKEEKSILTMTADELDRSDVKIPVGQII